MKEDVIWAAAIILLIILCAGEPDLLDAIIGYINRH